MLLNGIYRRQPSHCFTKTRLTQRLETAFFNATRVGTTSEIHSGYDELFQEIVISEAGNLSSIKARILSLFTVLRRSVTDIEETFYSENEEKSPSQDTFYNSLTAINQASNIKELWELTIQILDKVIERTMPNLYQGNSPVMLQAVSYIHNNYTKPIRLEQLAQHLHLNPSYLSSLIKKEMNMTFTQYVNHVRVAKSQVLLVSQPLSLSEISSLVGFEDQSYFSKVFKRITGMTPMAFKQSSY